jgi:hypothetical protein
MINVVFNCLNISWYNTSEGVSCSPDKSGKSSLYLEVRCSVRVKYNVSTIFFVVSIMT